MHTAVERVTNRPSLGLLVRITNCSRLNFQFARREEHQIALAREVKGELRLPFPVKNATSSDEPCCCLMMADVRWFVVVA